MFAFEQGSLYENTRTSSLWRAWRRDAGLEAIPSPFADDEYGDQIVGVTGDGATAVFIDDQGELARVDLAGNARKQVIKLRLGATRESFITASLSPEGFVIEPPLPITAVRAATEPAEIRLTTGAQIRGREYTLIVARHDGNGDGVLGRGDGCLCDLAGNLVNPDADRETFLGAPPDDSTPPRVVSAGSVSNTEIVALAG